jgi:phosphoribosylformimino-5-aminoimidazole carboxamide ribotide isomerase
MYVIPAIDLRKGRCVRLVQGDLRDETVYSQEPVSVAKLWKLKGAKRLHVIDLDGAFSGKLSNLEYVKDIIKATDMKVQVGGGIRDLKTIEKVMDLGVSSVILGTSAVQNKEFVKEAVKEYGKAIIAGIDAKKGMVAIKGWKQVTKVNAVDLAKEMADLGVGAIIFTDIQRDGMLEGPNFKSTKELAVEVNIPVIVSGGISSYRDIEHAKRLEKYGIDSVIIGKALYTGKIDLKQAIKIAKEPPAPKTPKAKKKKKKNS